MATARLDFSCELGLKKSTPRKATNLIAPRHHPPGLFETWTVFSFLLNAKPGDESGSLRIGALPVTLQRENPKRGACRGKPFLGACAGGTGRACFRRNERHCQHSPAAHGERTQSASRCFGEGRKGFAARRGSDGYSRGNPTGNRVWKNFSAAGPRGTGPPRTSRCVALFANTSSRNNSTL